MRAVAIDGDVIATKRLHYEVADHTPVVWLHARPVGVEDAADPYVGPVLSVIVEKEGFGTALAFVVAGADTDRVDVAPIVFPLRMDLRIAIDLACRSLEDTSTAAPRHSKRIDRTEDRSLNRRDGVVLIMNGACRAGEIVDPIDLKIDRLLDIMPNELEAGIIDEVADTFFASELARDAVRSKVLTLYPPEEVDEFTELFFDRIQQWRARASS